GRKRVEHLLCRARGPLRGCSAFRAQRILQPDRVRRGRMRATWNSCESGDSMNAIAANAHMGMHVLRCVHCGTVQRRPGSLFRCGECNELLEVIYPDWGALDAEAGRLKQVWKQRRSSNAPQDVSGVWRYRELLPGIERQNMITMGEGNTPLAPLQQ